MTNEQILKKAIEKAVKNGFKISEETKDYYITELVDNAPREGWETAGNYRDLIFSHDFAKCFWGTEIQTFLINEKCLVNDKKHSEVFIEIEKWKWYLMEMIKEKEPLKYLERFL